MQYCFCCRLQNITVVMLKHKEQIGICTVDCRLCNVFSSDVRERYNEIIKPLHSGVGRADQYSIIIDRRLLSDSLAAVTRGAGGWLCLVLTR